MTPTTSRLLAAGLAVLALAPPPCGAQDAPTGELPGTPTGDPEAGAALFDRQCVSCHVVVDGAGETLAGRSARTGPNLYGVAGRVPGTFEGFDYGRSMLAYGATGAAWQEASLAAYVQDPTGFLREALGDPRALGKMAYRVRDEGEARDLYAFLASLAPPPSAPPSAPGD